MNYPCPCCGFKVFIGRGCYDICPICFWEDELSQEEDPYTCDGVNKVSLYNAQRNYLKFGACEYGFVDKVRNPNNLELKDDSWKLIELPHRKEIDELDIGNIKSLEGIYTIAKEKYGFPYLCVDNKVMPKKIVFKN